MYNNMSYSEQHRMAKFTDIFFGHALTDLFDMEPYFRVIIRSSSKNNLWKLCLIHLTVTRKPNLAPKYLFLQQTRTYYWYVWLTAKFKQTNAQIQSRQD